MQCLGSHIWMGQLERLQLGKQLLLRRDYTFSFQYPVDQSSMVTCGAADEHGLSARVVVGNGSRLGGGMLSALRKNKDKSEEAVRKWRGGGACRRQQPT